MGKSILRQLALFVFAFGTIHTTAAVFDSYWEALGTTIAIYGGVVTYIHVRFVSALYS